MPVINWLSWISCLFVVNESLMDTLILVKGLNFLGNYNTNSSNQHTGSHCPSNGVRVNSHALVMFFNKITTFTSWHFQSLGIRILIFYQCLTNHSDCFTKWAISSELHCMILYVFSQHSTLFSNFFITSRISKIICLSLNHFLFHLAGVTLKSMNLAI